MSPKRNENVNTEHSPLMQTIPNDGNFDSKASSVWKQVSNEVSEQLKTAIPTLQSMVLTKIPWLISIRFVGGLGSNELAAAALATTLCNVTGLSFSVGLSFALTTLSGQAKGDMIRKSRNPDPESSPKTRSGRENSTDLLTPLVYLFRGLIIQLSLVIPIGVWWILGTQKILSSLGQSEQIASMTDAYLRILAPGLWSYSISWTLTAWVQSIGMADIPVYAAVLGLALHVPLNWFFIHFLNLGYIGCAVATVCFQGIQPVFILAQLFGTQHGRRRVLESTGGLAIGKSKLSWKREFLAAISSTNGLFQYLSLALPGIVIISEWWASELSIFLSGMLEPFPDPALGGMTIYQSINTFCFMFPVAFSVSASTRVANLLGEGKPKLASFAGRVSIGCAATVSFVIGTALFLVPHDFLPSLFAPSEADVIRETSRTMPLLATYVFADGIQVALNGIVKGCGLQYITMPIVIFAYWVVGLPIGYYNAFIRHNGTTVCGTSYFCGDAGLVAGMTVGTWVHMMLLAIAVWIGIDWNAQARKAQERVSTD